MIIYSLIQKIINQLSNSLISINPIIPIIGNDQLTLLNYNELEQLESYLSSIVNNLIKIIPSFKISNQTIIIRNKLENIYLSGKLEIYIDKNYEIYYNVIEVDELIKEVSILELANLLYANNQPHLAFLNRKLLETYVNIACLETNLKYIKYLRYINSDSLLIQLLRKSNFNKYNSANEYAITEGLKYLSNLNYIRFEKLFIPNITNYLISFLNLSPSVSYMIDGLKHISNHSNNSSIIDICLQLNPRFHTEEMFDFLISELDHFSEYVQITKFNQIYETYNNITPPMLNSIFRNNLNDQILIFVFNHHYQEMNEELFMQLILHLKNFNNKIYAIKKYANINPKINSTVLIEILKHNDWIKLLIEIPNLFNTPEVLKFLISKHKIIDYLFLVKNYFTNYNDEILDILLNTL